MNTDLNEAPFAEISNALIALQKGNPIILIDSESRENEGDLIIAAEKITAEGINFMINYGRGLVCLAMTGEELDRYSIPLMPKHNSTPFQTAFTVSVDAAQGITTGISAADRARTIQVLVNPHSTRDDFVTPGHIFPLRAHPGGVLSRPGHTEGSIELARLAGLKPACAICEILNPDGTMARFNDSVVFSRTHKLPLITMESVIQAVKK